MSPMFTIHDRSVQLCDGLSRREFLRAGGLSLFGMSIGAGLGGALGAPHVLASPIDPSSPPKAKACIVLFLMGGPPQHSTWDPKPDAPAEVRGEIGPIATNVSGISFGELMPRLAGHADKLAVLRAVATDDNAHSSSGYFMMTGVPHQPMNRENANPGPPNNWPNMAAVVQYLQTGRHLMPPAVRLPHKISNTDKSVWPGQDSGFLGQASDPWLFRCEPASPDFRVPQFELRDDVPLARLDGRRSLLTQLESQLASAEKSRAVETYDERRRQAFDLLTSAPARAACNLALEADEARDRYGRGQFGQSVLLARRLVEAGVKFVQVNWFRGPDEPDDNPCWDSHTDETNRLKKVLVPPMDMAFSALLEDLSQRGMLDETLVVCSAEFGRTPRFNPRAGRDHWGHVFSVALAGGGIRGGTVYGASDKNGAYPQEGLVRPQDLTATIFHCLGYSAHTEIHDRLGRPLAITKGEVIQAIL